MEKVNDKKESQHLVFGKRNFVGLREGTLSNLYEIQEPLGKGGFGQVYNVRSRTTKEVRACKFILKKDVKNDVKFGREIEILKNADHPNIVKLFEVLQDERHYYIVTEKCKGGDLSNRVIQKVQQKNSKYGEEDIKRVFLQVMLAINYCHCNNICHRDIKL